MFLKILMLLCLWIVTINGSEETSDVAIVNVEEGETAVLPCTVPSLGTNSVLWMMQGSRVPLTIGKFVFVPSARISVHEEGSTWKLIIDKVAIGDAGNFECYISGETRDLVRTVKLEITQARVSGLNLKGTETVEQSGVIHLICTVSGAYGVEVDWFFDGRKIRISDPFWHGRLTVKERLTPDSVISEVDIKPSQMDDAGTYVCRSSNMEVASLAVRVNTKTISDETTTLSPTTATQIIDNASTTAKDEMDPSDETDFSESEEVSEKMMKVAQLKFYRDQVLTNTKMRQMMDTEREFYEAMLRFLQEREKENTH